MEFFSVSEYQGVAIAFPDPAHELYPSPESPRFELTSFTVRLISPFLAFLCGFMTFSALAAWKAQDASIAIVPTFSALALGVGG